ncbi:ETS homologous factor [Hemiscyllium ocellatum]|uniref:ETS homologous factor n=1 Tax=Hemiscyllium ocellatum TaxID=170820 RepID=UPI0029661877|nr:ETS homologous factor [Hemiscyllium ocellatum]XP_060694386.1 ETS homologous factor [Hemiscyllium ocellatum]
MNAQFRCHPVLQQLPFHWNSTDLENNASSGYSGSSWHLTHPQLWSKYQVWEWLQHTLDANQLDGNCIHFQDFNLTGEQLCSMSLEHFNQVAGPLGPLLFASLGNLKWSSKCLHSPGQPLVAEQRGVFLNGMLFPVNGTVKSQAIDLSTVNNAWKEDEYLFQNKYGNSIDNEEVGRKEAAVKSDPEEAPDSQDVKRCVRSHRSSGCKRTPRGTHLWEFLRDVLLDPDKNPGLLKWEDRSEGVFRFLKSEAVAQLWGKKKNNSSMTYEKLSRAMRYYYKREILERVDGRRLVYKFGKKAHGWRHYDQQ